jgi:hypothetical protein
MTFDERMEALTRNLQLLAAMRIDTERKQAEMDRILARDIRAAVREARHLQRLTARRDAEFRARFAQLTAAQERTAASLRAFLDGLPRKSNPH